MIISLKSKIKNTLISFMHRKVCIFKKLTYKHTCNIYITKLANWMRHEMGKKDVHFLFLQTFSL